MKVYCARDYVYVVIINEIKLILGVPLDYLILFFSRYNFYNYNVTSCKVQLPFSYTGTPRHSFLFVFATSTQIKYQIVFHTHTALALFTGQGQTRHGFTVNVNRGCDFFNWFGRFFQGFGKVIGAERT